jgi:putative serine/threonine protein kinase
MIIDDFKQISVKQGIDQVEINNPTNYPLIGKGKQGAVFKISADKCVKFYWNPNSANK